VMHLKPNTPVLHYSNTPFMFCAPVATLSRIGLQVG
jgi:hypothetical protein